MRRIVMLSLMTIVIAGPAGAGVRVVPEAAWRGDFGLRVDVTRACAGEEVVLVDGTVSGEERVEACREVVVTGEVAGTGSLVAVGGERVVFGDGFRVAAGGSLEAGSSGRSPGFVVEPSPVGEPELFMRAHVRADGAGLGAGEEVSVLGLVGDRGELATVVWEGGGSFRLEVVTDLGERVVSESVGVGAGWHAVEVHWEAGSAIAADGRVEVLVNEASAVVLDGLAVGQGLVEEVWVGAWDGSREDGWVDLDGVAAARSGPIGALE